MEQCCDQPSAAARLSLPQQGLHALAWPASMPRLLTWHLLHPHSTCLHPCTVTAPAPAATAALTPLAPGHTAMQLVAAPAPLWAS